jgi:hypothetical protein
MSYVHECVVRAFVFVLRNYIPKRKFVFVRKKYWLKEKYTFEDENLPLTLYG